MVPSSMPDEWILRHSPPESAPGLVLVVDDEAPILLALRRILEADRHEVLLASSPAEATPILAAATLDVVLMDLVMGEESGLELLETVKRERPEVEVIVMTGHSSVESAVDCMRRGAFDYLSKPFENLRRVRGTVRGAVARRRSPAEGASAPGRGPVLLPEREFGAPETALAVPELPLSLDAYEKSALERALRESAGDAGLAARRLGIGRSTLYRKLAKHGIGDGRSAGAQARAGVGGVGSHPSIG